MKKALSLQAQIKRLEERGIIVQDEEKAKEILFRYWLLSPWILYISFREDISSFK